MATSTANRADARHKVVLLLQDLTFGGTQRQAIELARRLDPAVYDPELWTLMNGNDFLDDAKGCDIRVVQLARGPAVGPRALLQLYRRLRSHKPDILLLLTGIPNIWGRIFGKHHRVPVIIGSCRQRRNPKQQHERLLKRLADHHICNAHSLKQLLTDSYAIPARNVSVIHNGVDTTFFTPRSGGPVTGSKRILCLARLVDNKDHDTLLTAFEQVQHTEPGAKLIIAGNGPRRKTLAAQLAARFPDGSVELRPAVSDTLALYHDCDVFALSSVREGLPNVILEAMACGLPVAATAVDGVPEMIEHGVTGLLSPARNPEALADSLLRLLSDKSERARLGNAARQHVTESFPHTKMARSFETVFSNLLHKADEPGTQT